MALDADARKRLEEIADMLARNILTARDADIIRQVLSELDRLQGGGKPA